MTQLSWGRLSGESVQQWSELTNELARVDGTEEFYEPADLAEELTETGTDPSRDTWAVWDDGRMVAFGQLRVGFTVADDETVRLQVDGGVLPGWRGRGIGTRIMDEMESRALALNAERNPGVPGTFRASGGRQGSQAEAMLRSRGYETARWFTLMERANPGAGVSPTWGALSSPTPADRDDVLTAHNAAFVDHWGFAPYTPERWHDLYTSRTARPQFSTIAHDVTGAVSAYVLVSQYLRDELYVDLVGTIPAARGRGMARAALTRTIALVQKVPGIRVLGLEVDSESPTGATRLYEGLGFEPKHTTSAMTKPGEPPRA